MIKKTEEFQYVDPSEFPKWIGVEVLRVLERYSYAVFTVMEVQSKEAHSVKERKILTDRHTRALEIIERLKRAISSIYLEATWNKVGSLVDQSNPTKGNVWFAGAILDSFIKPTQDVDSAASSLKWKGNLLKKLKSIRTDLIGTPSNYKHWYNDFSSNMISSFLENPLELQVNKDELINLRLMGLLEPDFILDKMIKSLDRSNYNPAFSGVHVKGVNATRQYFCRSLTKLLIDKTHLKCRKVVAETTSIVFDCDITEREVIRLTKEVPQDPIPYYFPVHSSELFVNSCLD